MHELWHNFQPGLLGWPAKCVYCIWPREGKISPCSNGSLANRASPVLSPVLIATWCYWSRGEHCHSMSWIQNFSSSKDWEECGQGRRDRGGVGGVGKQKIIYHKTLSYIRFTVGQYWLRIKKNGKNSVNFVNFRKFVVCHEKFWYVRKIFGPLKWYTDQNFFCDGGGGRLSKIILSRKIFLSANFTLTPPLFSPPRYGPECGHSPFCKLSETEKFANIFRQNQVI
jgi:hypothetical protein